MEKFDPQQTLSNLIAEREGWAVCRANHENKFAESLGPAREKARQRIHEVIDWAANLLNNPEFTTAMSAADQAGLKKEFAQRFHAHLVDQYERRCGIVTGDTGHADLTQSLMFSYLYKQQAPLVYMNAMRMIEEAQGGAINMDAGYLKNSADSNIERCAKNVENIKPAITPTPGRKAPSWLDNDIITQSFINGLGSVDPKAGSYRNMTREDVSMVQIKVAQHNLYLGPTFGPDPNKFPPLNRQPSRMSKAFGDIYGAISNAAGGLKPGK